MEYYVIKSEQGHLTYIGRMLRDEIVKKLQSGQISGDYLAAETGGYGYLEVLQSKSVVWTRVEDLAAGRCVPRDLPQTGQAPESSARRPLSSSLLIGVLAGACIGTLTGFLMRPSVPFLGQLPLSAVISRGATLRELDQLMAPIAVTSFNYLITGLVLGSAIGALVSFLLRTLQTSSTQPTSLVVSAPQSMQQARPEPGEGMAAAVSENQTTGVKCPRCGRQSSNRAKFCAACGSTLGCPSCGSPREGTGRFCPHCGADLEKEAVPTARS